MSGPNALTNAIAGLDVTQARIDTLTRNISNAQTVGYNAKVQEQSVGPSGTVQAQTIRRAINEGLQKSMLISNGSVSSLTTTVNLMQSLTSLFGSPDAATTVSAMVTKLQTAYQDLSANPENASLRSSVINAAASLSTSFNTLNTGIENARASALDQINSSVGTVNLTLTQIAEVNKNIQNIGNTGGDMTDLADHLDSLLTTLSKNMNFNSFTKSDGTVSIYTTQGQQLVDGSTVTPLALAAGGTLETAPVNGPPAAVSVTNGNLGALLTARNVTFPGYETQLDNIASVLTQQFQNIGVPLFNDGGSLAYDPANATGYSGRIAVNQAIVANPQILRDGNSPTPLMPGDATNINAAVAIFNNNTLAFTAPGLPPTGTISQASANFVAGAAVTQQQISDNLTQETAVQTTLQNQISSQSGVNVDEQVAQLTVLQQAYSANARMIQASRDMFSTLLTAVGGA